MQKAIAKAIYEAEDVEMEDVYDTDIWHEDDELKLEDDFNSENVDAVDGIDEQKDNADQASPLLVVLLQPMSPATDSARGLSISDSVEMSTYKIDLLRSPILDGLGDNFQWYRGQVTGISMSSGVVTLALVVKRPSPNQE